MKYVLPIWLAVLLIPAANMTNAQIQIRGLPMKDRVYDLSVGSGGQPKVLHAKVVTSE